MIGSLILFGFRLFKMLLYRFEGSVAYIVLDLASVAACRFFVHTEEHEKLCDYCVSLVYFFGYLLARIGKGDISAHSALVELDYRTLALVTVGKSHAVTELLLYALSHRLCRSEAIYLRHGKPAFDLPKTRG